MTEDVHLAEYLGVDGNLDDYGSDDWAAAQVARFANVPIDDVLDA